MRRQFLIKMGVFNWEGIFLIEMGVLKSREDF